jgi:hypothetical protein
MAGWIAQQPFQQLCSPKLPMPLSAIFVARFTETRVPEMLMSGI